MPTLSGAIWVSRFPTSRTTNDLALPFRTNVTNFIAALNAARASVSISATLRPVERAFLMHYSFRIAREALDPATVPAMAGVDIDWVHRDARGNVNRAASQMAAAQMVSSYDIVFRPALNSNHTRGLAIDMTISNYLNKNINNATGTAVLVRNAAGLHALGATYSVLKLATDPPHWSSDGR
jgi:D-alanyl-D-alanine dipeptidase